MARTSKFSFSMFYCPNCGKKAMELPRPVSLTRSAFHKKKLYCPWCKNTYNCIECRNENEKNDFLEMYKNGEFKEESAAFEGCF